MKVALITVTFNSEAPLRRHWSAGRPDGAEWVVVDNASSDRSAETAEELGAKVIRLSQNRGFSAANNVGARAAEADCYIFVNPDVSVSSSGVQIVSALALARDALVAPQLMNQDGTRQENGRSAPYLYRKIQHYLGLQRSRESYELLASPGEVRQVSWVIGAAVAIPAPVFERIGGWNEEYFIYYEDSDICLRAKEAGYDTFVTGSVTWQHGWARATRSSKSLTSWKFELRSARRFYSTYPRLLLHPRVGGRHP